MEAVQRNRAHRAAGRSWSRWCGGLLLMLLLTPPLRHATEASMSLHMLVQYPGLVLAGALCAGDRAAAVPQRWHRYNAFGIAGLLGSALVLAVLMVPRVLDLALVDLRVEVCKVIALVASGAALRVSWQPAGVVLQAFYLGNLLPMMAVVGTLYQDTTTRVCNAYRLQDQQLLGTALCWLAAVVAAWWLLCVALRTRPSAD
jgi:hypothetical protein